MMKTINFENLPSTNTPINSTNLNELQDNIQETLIAVQNDTTTNNERIWVKKSKNLFNMNEPDLLTGYLDGDGNYISSSDERTLYIECEPNTTYTISKVKSARFIASTFSKVPSSGSTQNATRSVSGTTLTITTTSNDKYLLVFYYHSSQDTLSEWDIRSSIQIEVGSTPTAYELGSSHSVLVNRGNGNEKIYDSENTELYSTREKRIGTWIDGKPLYRKIIDYGTLPNTTTRTLEHNISNVDIFTKVEGIANDGITFLPLPYAHSNVAFNVVLNTTKTYVSIATNSDRTTYTKTYITLEYTKTTD